MKKEINVKICNRCDGPKTTEGLAEQDLRPGTAQSGLCGKCWNDVFLYGGKAKTDGTFDLHPSGRNWYEEVIHYDNIVKKNYNKYFPKENKEKKGPMWIGLNFDYNKYSLLECRKIVNKITKSSVIEKAFWCWENITENYHVHMWCEGHKARIRQHIKRHMKGMRIWEYEKEKGIAIDGSEIDTKWDYMNGITDEEEKNKNKENDKIQRKVEGLADIYIKNYDEYAREVDNLDIVICDIFEDKNNSKDITEAKEKKLNFE